MIRCSWRLDISLSRPTSTKILPAASLASRGLARRCCHGKRHGCGRVSASSRQLYLPAASTMGKIHAHPRCCAGLLTQHVLPPASVAAGGTLGSLIPAVGLFISTDLHRDLYSFPVFWPVFCRGCWTLSGLHLVDLPSGFWHSLKSATVHSDAYITKDALLQLRKLAAVDADPCWIIGRHLRPASLPQPKRAAVCVGRGNAHRLCAAQ